MRSTVTNYWWDETTKWSLSLVTGPTVWPVTEDEIKANALIDIDDGDTWVESRIKSATQLCEVFLKRSFCTTSWRLSLDRFPNEFYLPRPPLISVASIKYLDLDGVQQTLASNQYTVDAYSEPGRITPAYNVSWPTHRDHTNSIEVLYSAGYGAAAAVPQSIKDAIIFTVTQWHENRGDEGDKTLTELPAAAKALLRANSWGYLA